MADAATVLEATGVTMQFGGLKAVDDFNLRLRENDLVALIGPNGAGKTTVFNTLTGVYQPTKGAVFVRGQPIAGLKPHMISRLGLTRTFQNIRLFKALTVLDNVLVAMRPHVEHAVWHSLLAHPTHFLGEAKARRASLDLLSIFGLADLASAQAGSLPYGQQRKLEIVRCLATQPKILLLDEPAAGMNDRETTQLMDLIRQIRKDFKLSILLIEHDMKLVMGISQEITVLDYGVTIARGTPTEIKSHPKVIAAYLGVDAAADQAPSESKS